MDLFEHSARQSEKINRPLADRMRPETLAGFVGQGHVVGRGTLIRSAIEDDRIFSMILWGPPGCGKTTLARIIANETRSHFVSFSAVLSGVKQIRAVIDEARHQRQFFQNRTVLFVDEIHRFNKAQQDAFLHHVESGLITLIGATTENPSFEVIPALMSRCRVFTMKRLDSEDLVQILRQALADSKNGLGQTPVAPSGEALAHLARIADGDARTALSGLEAVCAMALRAPEQSSTGKGATVVTLAMVESALNRKALQHDKSGEAHYNLISAFHKSLRGSDPDAALYWLTRMLGAGENPFYVLRRMVRFASEDVGNADPHALAVALEAMEAYRFLGSPEGELAIAQAAAYLACAPKSNSIYAASKKIRQVVDETGALPVPLHIRNAPTQLMRDLGYGKNYRYAHDYPEGFVPQSYLPDPLAQRLFYFPTDRGAEKIIKQRLDRWRRLKQSHKNDKSDGGRET